MSLTAEQEEVVRDAAVARFGEFGRQVGVSDLRLSTMAVEGLSDVALFRAATGGDEDSAVIAGSVSADGSVNTLPNYALVQIWRRWIDERGRLPDPVVVVRTSMFLLAGEDHRMIVLTEDDRQAVTRDPDVRGKVQLPRALDDGRTGVVFWMSRHNLSEVTLVLEGDMIEVDARTIEEMA